jgi:hypothetical protein
MHSFCAEDERNVLFPKIYTAVTKALSSPDPKKTLQKVINEFQKHGVQDPLNYCSTKNTTILDLEIKALNDYGRKTTANTIRLLTKFGAKKFVEIPLEIFDICYLLTEMHFTAWSNLYKIRPHSFCINDTDKETGNTLLFYACHYHAPINIITQLVEDGIDINKRNKKGVTAIFNAHTKEIFNYLLEKGACLTIVGYDGCNIMHYSAYDNLSLLKIILETGTDLQYDLFRKNCFGYTPKNYARNPAVRKLISTYYPYTDKVLYLES